MKSFAEAEHEIGTILRAMARAHVVFVKEKLELLPLVKEGKQKSAQSTDKTFTFDNVKRNELGPRLQYDGYPVSIQGKGRKNEWEIMTKPDLVVIAPREFANRVIVSGKDAGAFYEKYKTMLVSVTTGKSKVVRCR